MRASTTEETSRTTADDNGPAEGEDGGLEMDDEAGSNGDVAFETDILTDDRFGMDRELVPSEWVS